MLRILAFLAPDRIPESIFTHDSEIVTAFTGADSNTGSAWAELVAHLTQHSLVQRDASDGFLSIHRLVQCVLRDEMDAEERSLWCLLTVEYVNHAFPDVEFANWSRCTEILPHSLAAIGHAEQNKIETEFFARLLNQSAYYIGERAEYQVAEPLFERALEMRVRLLGTSHPATATSINNLAYLYKKQGDFDAAEALYAQALSIVEQELGAEHYDTACSLNNLANLYREQGRFAEAEPMFIRALSIIELVYSAEHPNTIATRGNLATLYRVQGKLDAAEPLYKKSLFISEHVLGAEHPFTIVSLDNLAALYFDQKSIVKQNHCANALC